MSRDIKVTADGLAGAIKNIVQEYSDEVVRAMPEAVKEAGKECVKILQSEAAAAGIGGSKYKRSFRAKTTKDNSRETTVTVSSTQYQLTHLLERGHVIRNRPGGRAYGVTRAFPHWAPAEEKASEALEKKIRIKIEGES